MLYLILLGIAFSSHQPNDPNPCTACVSGLRTIMNTFAHPNSSSSRLQQISGSTTSHVHVENPEDYSDYGFYPPRASAPGPLAEQAFAQPVDAPTFVQQSSPPLQVLQARSTAVSSISNNQIAAACGMENLGNVFQEHQEESDDDDDSDHHAKRNTEASVLMDDSHLGLYIIDNSESMQFALKSFDEATGTVTRNHGRWNEAKENVVDIAEYNMKIGKIGHYFLMNPPSYMREDLGRGGQSLMRLGEDKKWIEGTDYVIIDPNHPSAAENYNLLTTKLMHKDNLVGDTPIHDTVAFIRDTIENRVTKKSIATLTIITDGTPSYKDKFEKELYKMTMLEMQLSTVIVFTADEPKTQKYFEDLDLKLKGLDFLDDFENERLEVAQANPWFIYSKDVHIARLSGAGGNAWADLLDEDQRRFNRQSAMSPYEIFKFITEGFMPTARAWKKLGLTSNIFKQYLSQIHKILREEGRGYFKVDTVMEILNLQRDEIEDELLCDICMDAKGTHKLDKIGQECTLKLCLHCANRIFEAPRAKCPQCKREAYPPRVV